jgi:hypothetical protein
MLKESAESGKRASLANGRPPQKASHDTTLSVPTFTDLNISRDQSSRWQKLASMPEEHFEAAVSTAKAVAGDITTAFVWRQQRRVTSVWEVMAGSATVS